MQFKNRSKVFPVRVIIYWDGVSDSQEKECLSKEIPAIKAGFKEMDANIDLMIIITNKKCVTWYFKTQGSNLQSAGPGTIVTETIVDKSKFDFYLVSQ